MAGFSLGLSRLTPPRGGRGTGLPAVSASGDGKTYTSGAGLKVGSTAILYANGTQVATTTVSGSGIAIWTLSTAIAAGATLTYDGVITGSAGVAAGGGTSPVTLNALSLSQSTATVGTAYSGTISGATAGSSITTNGAGLSISGSGTTRTLSGTPQAAGSVDLVETLSGAMNSPRTTSGLLTVSATGTPSPGDPNRYMFAATRLRGPSILGTIAGSGTTYHVHSFKFGTPDYETTLPLFFLNSFYQKGDGTQGQTEFDQPTAYQFEKLAIKVGDTWYECPTAPFMVDPAVDPVGFVLDAIPGVTLPANAVLEGRMAWNAPGGSTLYGATRANDIGEVSTSSTTGSLAAKCTDGSALTQNGFARQVMPAFMVAKGWDGREVGALAGDSIEAGANENSIVGFQSPRGAMGFWQRGLDDNTQSLRIPYGMFALEGSRPSDWQNRANWSRKLDSIKKITTLNGGKTPFTFVGSNHGSNSSTVANPYSWLTGFWQVCRTEWPGIKIYHSEMLPRPTAVGTDGFQTLEGQAPTATESYNGGTNPGIRWQANEIIGKGAPNGDPTARARVDLATDGKPYIDGSFAAWRPVAYDDGANRDKLAIVPLNTTLAAAVAASALTVTLTNVGTLQVGDILIVNPGGGSSSFDAVVKAISGNVVNMSSGANANAEGTKVTAAHHDRTGLHPGTRAHTKIANEAVIPWKQAMGWTVGAVAPTPTPTVDPAPVDLSNVPSALRAIMPGSDAYEGGAYLTGRRKVGRTSTAALKDAATATLPTGWQRDSTNKIITLTSSIPTGETTVSDWLFQDDWSINVLPAGGTTQNLTFTQCVFKPTKTKSFLVNHRTAANVTFTNNTIGGSIDDAAGSPMTFIMHPGGTGFHTYIDNAFWNMPEDHIRLSEGGGLVEGNFCFGGGQSQLEDPHYDTIQILPNVVPRTLNGPVTVRRNYFDMRRGIGHTQAVRSADIATVNAQILVEENVLVDPNFDISFSSADNGTIVRNNYFARQPFPSYQKNGAADFGEYLTPVPAAAIIYSNYRLETGALLPFEQNNPNNAAATPTDTNRITLESGSGSLLSESGGGFILQEVA